MKFLDLKGLQDLWSKVLKTRTEVEASNENGALITIAATESTVTGSDGLGKKFTISLGGLDNVASAAELEAGLEALYGGEIPESGVVTITGLDSRVDNLESGSVVTVEKQTTAESGYAATYVVKQNDAQVGVKINIPKDFLVKSGSVETVSTADSPYSGAVVGDKYIDFVVNTTDATETAQHIYLPVNDLVDVYTTGDGLTMSANNVIIGVVDPTSETFLTVGANGFKLTGVQAAINSAKSDVIGASTDTASADTIYGAKAYADDAVAAASGDYATAAQGTKADSALQTISRGTDGDYVTTTIGTKANNDQTVGVAVTIQPVSSASASAQGLVEASDVKTYIDNAVSTGTSNNAHKVANATAGNFASLDSNGDLADSGKKAADFATAAQGALADTAIQSVTGETAVTNGNYISVSVEAATDASNNVTLTSHANVTTQAVSTAATGTADGLATAADVKSYVDGQKTAVDTAIAAMDADLDASGTLAHNGVFVMSGVTQVDGIITAVDSVEVEAAGAAAAAKTELLGDATTNGNTLGKLEDRLDAIEGSGTGSISDQINAKVATLDSDVNVAVSASAGHVVSTSASNDGTTSTHVTAATVLTSLTITDGLFSAATSQTIEAISDSDLASILVAPSAQSGE